MEKDLILSVEDLSVEYHAGGEIVKAVNHVSFDVQRGHTLALVGETGAGKTTIAKTILSVLPDPPAKVKSGSITLNGRDMILLKERELRKIRGRQISMIFQDPMTALNPVLTVGKQIEEVILEHNKISHKQARQRTLELLKMVGIPGERYEEYPHQFSGGMRQRVVIAIALACNPELLIADEPTTALDVTVQAQVLDLIRRLKAQIGTSMILITHDLGIVAEQSDEVAIIYAGEIVEYGSVRQIFNETEHPYTVGLFNALPNMVQAGERLKPIHGLPPNPVNLPQGCKFHKRCPYAGERCCEELPELRDKGNGHYVRCHLSHTERACGDG